MEEALQLVQYHNLNLFSGVTSIPIRVRCELRGPEGVVRVRQVRVLGAPAQTPMGLSSNPSHTLHALVETETLRVFRLVTSQVSTLD